LVAELPLGLVMVPSSVAARRRPARSGCFETDARAIIRQEFSKPLKSQLHDGCYVKR
jgi:hypothetical protein